MRPSGVSINPPISVEWDGKIVKVSDAKQSMKQLGIPFERQDEFLTAVYNVMPSLVADVDSIAEVHVHFGDIHAYLKALKSRWVDSEVPIVSKELALKRLDVCLACSELAKITGCYGCSGISKLMMHIPENVTEVTHGCKVCKCYLNNKVWMSKEVIDSDDRDLQYPENCWIFQPELLHDGNQDIAP